MRLNKIISALIAVMLVLCFGHVQAQPKRQVARIIGIWKGEVQLLHHNTRFKEPEYYHIGKIALSIDSYGNVIGRIDNNCAFEGSTLGFGYNQPAKLNIKFRRCPDPEFNKRYTAVLTRTGEFLLSWEMLDETFPVVVRVNAKLELSKSTTPA